MLRRLSNGLVYSQVWISLGAASQVLLSGLYHSHNSSDPTSADFLIYAIAVFFGSLSFYSFHRLYTLWKWLPNLPTERWRIVHRYQRWLFAFVPIGAVLAGIFLLLLPWRVVLLSSLPALISALYALPVFRGRRGRDLGLIKLPWLAIGWVWICSVLPGLIYDNLDLWYALERLLFILGFALAFDWRDRDIDRAGSVRTWAVRLGRGGSAALSTACMIAALVITFTQLRSNWIPQVASTLPAAVATLLAIPMLLVSYQKRPLHHLHYGLWLDALLVLPMIVLGVGIIYLKILSTH